MADLLDFYMRLSAFSAVEILDSQRISEREADLD